MHPARIGKEVPEVVAEEVEEKPAVAKVGKKVEVVAEEFPRMECESIMIQVSYNFVEVT